MRDEVYACVARRDLNGGWTKLGVGAPDGIVQVDTVSAPVLTEVIAALKKAGLQVRVTNQ